MQQCPAGAALQLSTDPDSECETQGQAAINKHHVIIAYGFHVSCFLFFLRKQPPHRHAESQNNERKDTILEVKRLSLSYIMRGSVLCVFVLVRVKQ